MYCSNCGKQNQDGAKFCFNCGNSLADCLSPTSTSSVLSQTKTIKSDLMYAGFWKRFAAFILDILIIIFVSITLYLILSIPILITVAAITGNDQQKITNITNILTNIGSFFIPWLYYALMESSKKQGTLGKMVVGIKVIDIEGNRISFWRATGRNFSRILSAFLFCIGYLMIAFTEKKQALHDKMANCLVVNKNVNSLQIKQDGQATALSTPAFVGLILLALAISVSGILAPIIIPAYQNYKVRTQQGLSKNLSQFPFSTEKSDLQPKQLLTPLEEKNQKANAGDVLSQFELGTMYAEGQGVKRDYGEAIKWFQLAAQQGNKESQLYLGLMYAEGYGVKQNNSEAFKWIKLAANQGLANAQNVMGLIFSEGRLGFVKNYDVARRWYQKAADQEHKGAQDWLKNNNIKICEVKSVSDGDALLVDCGNTEVKVRIFGIDAPELGQVPWGNKSRNALASLVSSKEIRLLILADDQYGRSISQVFINDIDIGLEMVRKGYAVVYEQYNGDLTYKNAQDEAKTEQRGIWETPGTQQDPAAWRRMNPR